ncbi:M15 family metallopeptidase [Leuconostoc palmae]|uniref:M15 family metallopeptidase n=1 Tax=Leuconostoc palmae TaxID=501487 RepID=UPI001C7D45B9|nr:M15 family metallopeptidase [Leuconostoc palmae]
MRAITLTTEWSWKDVKRIDIVPSSEEMVSVNFCPNKIAVSPQYFLQGLPGALPELYLRRSVFKKILLAANNLPTGYKFLIYDGWRSIETQQAIFDIFFNQNALSNPKKTTDELTDQTLKIVALPSSDPKKPSPHSTGGSVDVTILDESGIPLDMGTKFDDSSIASSTAYFEKVDDIITENRRLLYHVMTEQGFTNYSEEWWHFDYGNQNWAWVLDKQHAIYSFTMPSFAWQSPFKKSDD